MLRKVVLAFVAPSLVAMTVSTSKSQDAAGLLDELYGRGVHAYFSGRFDQAQHYLDSAVAHGSRDPRCYYFRALVRMKTGRSQEAEQDFQTGAKLEFSSEGAYDVSRSLQRIQGRTRLHLERVRRDVRLASLRQRSRTPSFAVTPPGATDRASSPAAPSEGRVVSMEVEELSPDPSDPFARDTSGPIGATTMEKATVASEDSVARNALADGADDPFGDSAAGADDPFGTADVPAATDDPFDSGDQPRAGRAAMGGGSLRGLFEGITRSITGGRSRDTRRANPPPAGGAGDNDDPFGAAPAADDPFGAARPAADPFGEAAAPAPGPATTTNSPASPPSDDPFAGGNDAANDPFGGGNDAAADPFGGDDADADPFGGANDADADPFGVGDDADADPFGNQPAMEENAGSTDDEPEAPPSDELDDPFADDP